MKDTLIVYYSYEGNTELVATVLSDRLGADLLSIKPVKEMKTKGFSKYFWGGSQVFMRRSPDLLSMEKDIDDYKNIIIGTPVWAFSYAPPIRSLLNSRKINGKKVAVYCCHQGGPGNTIEKMISKLEKENVIIGSEDFFHPKENIGQFEAKMDIWAESLKEKIGDL